MSMHANVRASLPGAALYAAYRKTWLAGLGAAAMTRDWLDYGAAPMLRALVKEGTLVETKAMRAVESRVESSYVLAESAWQIARRQAGALLREARTTVPGMLATLPLPATIARVAAPYLAQGAKRVRARKAARKTSPKRIARRPAPRARKRA
jgi:glutathione S-transferase